MGNNPDHIPVSAVDVSVFRIPTESPESDGTLTWQDTILVFVQVEAAGLHGSGWTYAGRAAAAVIEDVLKPAVLGRNALATSACWWSMVAAVRNAGRPGIGAMAISAVDCALWDLKARLLNTSLAAFLGLARTTVPLYGSGGFTSYPLNRLQAQLGGWVEQGFECVKMKVGRHPADDVPRVRAARQAIGGKTRLFVDANGAYDRKVALQMAGLFSDCDVAWFEEPVSSDDLDGLRLIRDRAPPGMDVAAGEYGYDMDYFRRMLAHGAVDVLQADLTRCGGITGFRQAAVLSAAHHTPLSGHGAPYLHLAIALSEPHLAHLEWFYDHARIECMLFDGATGPVNGTLSPDLGQPGHGLTLKRRDAARFAV